MDWSLEVVSVSLLKPGVAAQPIGGNVHKPVASWAFAQLMFLFLKAFRSFCPFWVVFFLFLAHPCVSLFLCLARPFGLS